MESDYLEVTGLTGGQSKRYCKDQRPPAALTEANGGGSNDVTELRLTLQTNGVYDGTGFRALYEYSTFVPSTNNFLKHILP